MSSDQLTMTADATLEWEPVVESVNVDVDLKPVQTPWGTTVLEWHPVKGFGEASRPEVTPYDPEAIEIAKKGIKDVHRFYMVVHPVGIKKKTKGGIILADTTVHDQEWTHGMAQICMLGPSFYKGKRFEDQGLTQADGPRVGEVVYIQPRTPIRLRIDGKLFIIIADDTPVCTFNQDYLENISFNVG
jgi:co-chaperonin GroES (HSP10)